MLNDGDSLRILLNLAGQTPHGQLDELRDLVDLCFDVGLIDGGSLA